MPDSLGDGGGGGGTTRLRYHSTSFSTTSPAGYCDEKIDSKFADTNKSLESVLNETPGMELIGRPPWYNYEGKMKEAYVIGFCGVSGSGKTTVSNRIIEALNAPWVTTLSMDSFYKDPNIDQRRLIEKGEYDFDHPSALDFDLCVETLRSLKHGRSVDVPVYDFKTHSRVSTRRLYGASIIVFEGILTFYDLRLLELIDLKVFVNVDRETCFGRRLRRDTKSRNRTIESIIQQYITYVKPASEEFVLPSIVHADVILPNGKFSANHCQVGIGIIIAKIKDEIMKRGFKVRSVLRDRAKLHLSNGHHAKLSKLFVIHMDEATKIALKTTYRIDLNSEDSHRILCDERSYLMQILYKANKSIANANFDESGTVDSSIIRWNSLPNVSNDRSSSMQCRIRTHFQICGVSISRRSSQKHLFSTEITGNDYFAEGLLDIRTNVRTDEPELHYVRLPDQVHRMKVILADTNITTGAGTMMAIRTLLDHGVEESKIVLLAFAMSNAGCRTIGHVFPDITIITTFLGDFDTFLN
ncbi:hypothetical protein ACOME3_005814 [Neoechinorhynchus agilis]